MKKSTRKSKKPAHFSKAELGNPWVAALSSPIVGKVVTGAAIAAGLFVAYKLASGGLDTIQENKAAAQYGNNTKTGLAAQYAAEINATGLGSWFSNTDEQALYVIADKIYRNGVGLDLVNTQYQRLYNKNLVSELSNDLNSQELDKFNNILRGSGMSGLGYTPQVLKLL